jgi:hypothetical protein
VQSCEASDDATIGAAIIGGKTATEPKKRNSVRLGEPSTSA